MKTNKIINNWIFSTSPFHSPVICTSRKCAWLEVSMFLEESLKGQQCWWAEGVRWLVVAAASPTMGDATSGVGFCLWEGKGKSRGEGGAGRGAGDHRGAERLKVVVAGWGMKRLPVLCCVQRVGQVNLRHWPRRLHLCLDQQIQRLL